jgi:predicted metal-dependent hydrolase
MMTYDWPPEYNLRISSKAKRVTLRLSPNKGLEIIIPPYSSEKTALAFLQSKRDWVLKHSHILSKPVREKILPQHITLHALNESWQIRYEKVNNSRHVKLITLPKEIVLYGPVDNYDLCIEKLKNWLHVQSEKHLLIWLNKISNHTKLNFKNLTIRDQKTRWGSCSSNKNINLNYKLLFLSYPLVEYVIVHELCHTKYMNHSAKFWELVAEFYPGYSHARREIARESKLIPDWV